MGNSFSTDPQMIEQNPFCTISINNHWFDITDPNLPSLLPDNVRENFVIGTIKDLATILILENFPSPIVENISATPIEVLIQRRRNGLVALGLTEEEIDERLEKKIKYLLDKKNIDELTDHLSYFIIE